MGATLQPLVSPAPEEGAARHFNPATPNPSNVQASSADALFRMASALRAQGQAEAAIATFQKLESLFPDSRESRFSYVIAGRLLLTRGRPAQALSEFDQYLARRGAASEDALAGRAAALQALGQTDAEAETWQRVLAEYPKSVYDTRARARLTLLEPAKALPADSSAP
jgi:tetratricopeptide (TPR) repeat protein